MEMNDIGAVYAALCRQLTAAREINFASDEFQALDSNGARTRFAYRLLNEFKLFPEVTVQRKSDELSAKCRQKGNALFAQKKDEEALKMYSKSVALAEETSGEALGLAYANRSAVLLQGKRFRECLQDIDLALKHNYPQRLQDKLQERRRKVLGILSNQNTDAASPQDTSTTPQNPSATSSNPPAEKLGQKQEFSLNNGSIDNSGYKSKNMGASQDNLPSLGAQRSPTIECASAAVTIQSSPDLGRHVVATETINPGDVIAVERPFIVVLLEDNYCTHCYHCLKASCNLVPCTEGGGCIHAMFCSPECRTEAWNAYHRYECPILPTLLALGMGKLTLLALRVVLNIREDLLRSLVDLDDHKDDNKSLYKSGRYQEIHRLIANTDKRTVADLFERSVTAAVILKVLQDASPFFEECRTATDVAGSNGPFVDADGMQFVVGGLLLLHLQTAPSNMHEISELFDESRDEFRSVEIGAGAYSFLSMLNHDCAPNVVRNCHGTTIVLRALRTIRKGEQLMDNYGYHHAVMPVQERRQHLLKQYHFRCGCKACLGDWSLFHDLKVVDVPDTEDITEEEFKLLRAGDGHLAESIVQRLVKNAVILQEYVDKNGEGPPCKNFYENQEIMKQCFAIFGNVRRSL